MNKKNCARIRISKNRSDGSVYESDCQNERANEQAAKMPTKLTVSESNNQKKKTKQK